MPNEIHNPRPLPPLPETSENPEIAALQLQVNQLLRGRVQTIGAFDLERGTSQTVVTNNLFESHMAVALIPLNTTTINLDLYILSRENGQFTVGHKNVGQSDQRVAYLFIG